MKILFFVLLSLAIMATLVNATVYIGREGGGYRPAYEGGGWYQPAREGGGWYQPAREGGGWYQPGVNVIKLYFFH
jgi:hypothetical protein